MKRDTKVTCSAYLKWIRQKPCVICLHPSDDAHHIVARGRGSAKQNDFYALPFCRVHHSIIHARGADTYQVDLWEEVARNIVQYIVENWHVFLPQVQIGKE